MILTLFQITCSHFFRLPENKGRVKGSPNYAPFELSIKIAPFLLWEKKMALSMILPHCTVSFEVLKQHGYCYSILTDLHFKFEAFWKMKQKHLQSLGKGNEPFTEEKLSENYFYYSITNKYRVHLHQHHLKIQCSLCTNHFGMRPKKEIHNSNWGNVKTLWCTKFGVHCI